MTKFAIIGSGRAAKVLEECWKKTENNLIGCYNSRDQAIRKNLPPETVLILAVSDNAIHTVSQTFDAFPQIHLSGNTDLSALVSEKRAIVWPIQSLIPSETTLTNVPFICEVEGLDAEISQFTNAVGGQVVLKSASERKELHLGAVFLNNFSNYLFTIASEIIERPEDLSLYTPLMKNSVSRWLENDPKKLQTGPARRNDTNTINEHLSLLEDKAEAKRVYLLLTELIKKRYEEL